jgi:hypothetical protein
MAASIGLCMGTTFALCTAIPVAGEVHSPQAKKRAHNRAGHEFEDVPLKHPSYGGHGGHGKRNDDHDGHGGHGGRGGDDARVHFFSSVACNPAGTCCASRPCFFYPLIASEHTRRDHSCRAIGTLCRVTRTETGMPFWTRPISGS